MKKLFLPLIISLVFFISCTSNKKVPEKTTVTTKLKNNYVLTEAGKAVYTNIDPEENCVFYNQVYDGFEKVTYVDCSKSTSRNLITIDLEAYTDFDVQIDFECDLKVVNSNGESTDIIWFINEVEAGIPQLAREKVESEKWIHFSGSKELILGEKRQFYISAAGIDRSNTQLFLKNFNMTVQSDMIGKEKAVQVNWKDAPSLAKAYEPYFDYIGFATPMRGVLDNPEVRKGLEYQASCFTMENEFKPDFIFAWVSPGNFKDFLAEDGKIYQVPGNTPVFNNVDTILNYAKIHNLKMRGHVLVWHAQTPDWFFRQNYGGKNEAFVDEATMNARLEWYIKSILEYIKEWEDIHNEGKRIVITWDVVNEAASDNATNNQWLRTDSNWYRVYNSDRFIVNAFRYANKYAPKDVLLAYNDYGCASYNKCSAILKIVEAIQATPDARIDVVGMQSHIGMNTQLTGSGSFETSVHRFIEKGVDVQITELDIGSDGQRYNSEKLKIKYNDFFKMAMENRKTPEKNGIRGITMWGIVDERSWIYNNNGIKQHPLLFEKNYQCKPAFYGALEAANTLEN